MKGVSVLVVREITKEHFEVFLGKKDSLPSVPSADDMIQCSWEMDPRLTGHRNFLSNNDAHVNTELTKPDPIDLFLICLMPCNQHVPQSLTLLGCLVVGWWFRFLHFDPTLSTRNSAHIQPSIGHSCKCSICVRLVPTGFLPRILLISSSLPSLVILFLTFLYHRGYPTQCVSQPTSSLHHS